MDRVRSGVLWRKLWPLGLLAAASASPAMADTFDGFVTYDGAAGGAGLEFDLSVLTESFLGWGVAALAAGVAIVALTIGARYVIRRIASVSR